jgi:hypothetical protein
MKPAEVMGSNLSEVKKKNIFESVWEKCRICIIYFCGMFVLVLWLNGHDIRVGHGFESSGGQKNILAQKNKKNI